MSECPGRVREPGNRPDPFHGRALQSIDPLGRIHAGAFEWVRKPTMIASIDHLAVLNHPLDLSRIADVAQGIGIDDQQIRELPGLDGSQTIEHPVSLGGISRRRQDGLHRGQSHLGQQLHLAMQPDAGHGPAMCGCIRPAHQLSARPSELPDEALHIVKTFSHLLLFGRLPRLKLGVVRHPFMAGPFGNVAELRVLQKLGIMLLPLVALPVQTPPLRNQVWF